MNLLIINYMALPLPPSKGGAVEYLVDAFLKDNEKTHNHNITLYSIYDQEAEKQSKEYKYTRFKFIKIKGLLDKIDRIVRHLINRHAHIYIGNTYISKIIKAEKDRDKYDAIIIENAPEFGLKIPQQYRNKLILHLHNDYLNSKTKMAQKIFDCYDKIYTISNSLGDCVQSIEKSHKVMTLYNGIDLKRFFYDENLRIALRKKYNINNDDFVFMYCGRLVPDKGVYELVKAFSDIKNQNIKLLIVGGTGYSKNEESDYIKSIKEIADNRVILTGFLPYYQMAQMYSIPDVGVVPSMCNDGFNLTVVEFSACMVPLIISDRGAMKELVSDEYAIIAQCDEDFAKNIYNSLKYLIDNAEKIPAMRTKALENSKRFGIDKYCERFNVLLEKLKEEHN